ncbi:MAG: hypothetical protein KOO60_13190 [Gemmatimonadales bacterium]|nr:hypothetical protein [Gemmatimonadales bacterium]
MSKSLTISCNLLLGLVLLVFGSGLAVAQTEVEATAGWSAPTYGTPVAHYVLQHSVNGGDWVTIATPVDTEYTVTITVDDGHRVRVAGVDAEDRQGPYSLPSPEYFPANDDLGEPGQPGKPFAL